MKRQLSSFDIYVIVSELQKLKDGYVDNIYQLTRNELLIRVKKNKTKEFLFIRNGKLICNTEKVFDIPLKPSTFAMTLRKYLLNGRISDISQHEFDRIIKLKIRKKEGEYTLVIEFFSNGNIVLVDPEENIILPLIRQSWRDRKIKGREPYAPPPSQINPFNLTKEKFTALLRGSNTDIVRTLAVNLNLSGTIAEEVCKRADVDKKTKIEEIDDTTISKLYKGLTDFLNLFKEKKFEPVVVKKNNEIVDVLPFKFISYKNMNFERTDDLSRSLEVFIETNRHEEKKESSVDKELGKLNRQLAQQQDTVKKLQEQIQSKKAEGDLIYLNYQNIEKILEKIKQILDLKEKEHEIEKINEMNIVKKFDPNENCLIVNLNDTEGNSLEIRLDFRKTVAENAEKAYNDNKKLRSKLRGAEKSIKKTIEDIASVKKKEKLEVKKEKKRVKEDKLFWFERFRWFISSDGNVVVGGKDAKTNEIVVKKYLKEGDRYAHADIQGAPSIIIKNRGVTEKSIDISEKTLEEACVFAVSFSKAWKQFAEAQAYWVLPEQVSKTAQSGEFVPHGAFIIRGKRNYLRCKLELAVGRVKIDDETRVMCGPVSAVKNMTDKYVIIEPGDVKKSDLANKLSRVFDVPAEKADRVLPPGGTSIIQKIGIEL